HAHRRVQLHDPAGRAGGPGRGAAAPFAGLQQRRGQRSAGGGLVGGRRGPADHALPPQPGHPRRPLRRALPPHPPLLPVPARAGPGGPPPTNAEYGTEADSFAQILATATAATAAMGPDQFVVKAKDGTVRTYLPHAATRTSSGVAWTPNPVTGDVQTSTPRA